MHLEIAQPEPGSGQKAAGSVKPDIVIRALNSTFITIGTFWLVATLVAIGAYAAGFRVVAMVGAFAVATMMFAWLAALCFLFGIWAMRRFTFTRVLTGGKANTGTPG